MQLSEQQLHQFEQDGYLFFPDIFDADEVGILKRAAAGACLLEPLADDTLAELSA